MSGATTGSLSQPNERCRDKSVCAQIDTRTHTHEQTRYNVAIFNYG